MDTKEEVTRITEKMKREFDKFGKVTSETKNILNELIKDKNNIDEFRKYYQNSEN